MDFYRHAAQQVGHYELVATPAKAIALPLLPESLQPLASLILLKDVRFGEVAGVNPSNTVTCLQADNC
jgi:hypothetical protein